MKLNLMQFKPMPLNSIRIKPLQQPVRFKAKSSKSVAKVSANRATGFTLLEVMIALAVFAITALALLSQNNQGIHQTAYLQEKSYALWIAENTLTELRLAQDWPSLGDKTKQVSQFDRQWLVKTAISGTAEKSLRRVEVEVSRAGEASNLTSLRGYIGQY